MCEGPDVPWPQRPITRGVLVTLSVQTILDRRQKRQVELHRRRLGRNHQRFRPAASPYGR